MRYQEKTIGQFVNILTNKYSSKPAILYKRDELTEQYSFTSLCNAAKSTAAFFISYGLKKGDRLLVCAPSQMEYIAIMFAAGLTGVVLVPVDVNSTPSFVQTIIRETNPAMLIKSVETDEMLDEIKPTVNNTVFIEDLLAIVSQEDENILREINDEVQEDDLFEIIFTSGTTSNPKGVMLSHKNIMFNVYSLQERLECPSQWSFLNILPLSHMFGQVMGCFYPLLFGCTVSILEKMKPSLLQNSLLNDKIKFVVAVPELLKMMKDKIDKNVLKSGKKDVFEKMQAWSTKLPCAFRRLLFRGVYKSLGKKLSYFMVGGAALAEDVELFWEKIGVKVLQGYGLTETSPVVSSSSLTNRKVGSVGKALANQEIKINADGEIVTRGENVFLGYYKKPELNAEIFENGWFKTGDIGELDQEGNLFLRGRKKNMFLSSSGINVYPEDIEAELLQFPEVKSCVVYSENSMGKNLSINAVIITLDGFKTDVVELRKKLNDKLLNHQKVKGIKIWNGKDFPRTHTLKIKRNIVEEVMKQEKCLV